MLSGTTKALNSSYWARRDEARSSVNLTQVDTSPLVPDRGVQWQAKQQQSIHLPRRTAPKGQDEANERKTFLQMYRLAGRQSPIGRCGNPTARVFRARMRRIRHAERTAMSDTAAKEQGKSFQSTAKGPRRELGRPKYFILNEAPAGQGVTEIGEWRCSCSRRQATDWTTVFDVRCKAQAMPASPPGLIARSSGVIHDPQP
jgi:hypothetical protein